MTIQFDGLYDIKEFILMVDIYQVCDKVKPWGGLGYIVQDWYADEKEGNRIQIEDSDQSKVIWNDGDCIIVTPYYKQLSWLFETLRCISKEDYLDKGVFLNGFGTCCEELFSKSPDHSAKELMVYILEGLQRENDKRLFSASEE